MSEPITLSAEGYDGLAIILRDAFLQASEGKGAERHANSKPFHEQPMQSISDLFDSDKGMAFQIVKKLREGLDMPEYERLERELLGVIVYTAGAILWHKRRHLAETVSLVAAVEPPVTFKERCAEIDAEVQAAARAQLVDIYAQAAAHIAETAPQPRVVGMNPNLAAPFHPVHPEAAESLCEDCRRTVYQDHSPWCPQNPNKPSAELVPQPAPVCPGCGREEGKKCRRGCPTLTARLATLEDPFAGAPEWAKYKAQDADGRWFYYSHTIYPGTEQWVCDHHGWDVAEAGDGEPNPNWRETLIERPTK